MTVQIVHKTDGLACEREREWLKRPPAQAAIPANTTDRQGGTLSRPRYAPCCSHWRERVGRPDLTSPAVPRQLPVPGFSLAKVPAE